MTQIDFSKFRTVPTTTPNGTPTPNSNQPIDFSKFLNNVNQQPSGSSSGNSKAPAALSASQYILKMLGSVQGASAGFAKQGIKDVMQGGAPVESALDETLGRGINIAEGKGNEPTQTGAQTEAVSEEPGLQPEGAAQKTGAALEEGVSLIAPGEEAIDAIKGTPIAEKLATMLGKSGAQDMAKIAEDVSPRLTSKAAEGMKATNPEGILGKIKPVVTQRVKDMADAVKDVMTGKTFTEKANSVEKGISDEAEALKAKVAENDHPYTFKELNAAMSKTDIPEMVKTGDATVKKAFTSAQRKMLSIAKEGDGKISSLLDARKEFDSWVQKEYPNLYDSDTMTPYRQAIKSIRNTVNNFIEKNLPETGFQSSLKKQNLMYDALENLKEKAARGAPKVQGEIGTTAPERFAKNHPKMVKAAGNAAKIAGGAAVAGGTAAAGLDLSQGQ